MKIAAAKPEGAHASPARIAVGREPGTGIAVQVKMAVFNIQPGIRCFGFQSGGQNFVIQAQSGLDQPCCACRCLGVTDHRFNRSQGALVAVGAVFVKNLAKGLKFDLVTHPGAGTVGFNETDGCRIDAGAFIG